MHGQKARTLDKFGDLYYSSVQNEKGRTEMARILLYNIHGEKLAKIRTAAALLGITPIVVPEDAHSHPVGYLLGYEGFAPSDAAERIDDEMLVRESLFSPLLDYMRKSGATVALKAVVTEQNRAWSGAALCRELQREHEAMRSFAAKKQAHPHKKKK